MKTLILIPARGGSVGIPHKVVRPLAGVPPLIRTIETVRGLGIVSVITDDDEIANAARAADVGVIPEPKLPSAPGQHPLDPVIHTAVEYAEEAVTRFETIVTVQCTSPFLSRRTVEECLFALGTHDTALTVRDDRALRWERCPPDTAKHNMPARLTRQQMPPAWRETGGCLATRREHVTPRCRIGPSVRLVPVEGAEALDLDEPQDWALAELYAGITDREALITRLLMEPPAPCCELAVLLSSYNERSTEATFRQAQLARFKAPCLTPVGPHTSAEARMVLTQRGERNNLVLITSAYHQPRAFLTFLRVLQEQGLERTVRLWNAPAPSDTRKLAQEFRKIAEYQSIGHVASYGEGLAYLDWRDT